MKMIAAFLVLASLAACATSSPDAAPAAARTDSDDFQIETTVLAVYNVISGPAGRRDWDRFEALFAPEARMVVVGENGTTPMTTKQYIEHAKPNFDAKGWFEKPVATRILRYGNIAHVWSTYEGRERAGDEQPMARGINSIEMVKIGSEWKVQSLVWQKEDAAHPIPAGFLPAK